MKCSLEEVCAKLVDLGLWSELALNNWAVKPNGSPYPYFCATVRSECARSVKVRLLMLDGWQTLHDYLRTRADHNFGFYSTPMEFPHYELVVGANGATNVFRHDPGYVPQLVKDNRGRDLVSRILWEAYGMMIRAENEPRFGMTFASEKAIFARVEGADGIWRDQALPIIAARPQVENIVLNIDEVKAVQALPLIKGERLELDFRLRPELMTRDVRPRSVYELIAVDAVTGAQVFAERVSINPDGGLRELWQNMPVRVLHALRQRGSVPSEIAVCNGRVFRMLKAIGLELPIKLSMHDLLPNLVPRK